MAFGVNPDPDRPRTLGEQLDARLELDEQTFDAMEARIGHALQRIELLERAVAVLEALTLGAVTQ